MEWKKGEERMKVADLLISENAWTKEALARDAFGLMVNPLSSTVVSWCLVGAVIKAYGENTDACFDALTKLSDALHTTFPQFPRNEWQDGFWLVKFNNDPETTFPMIRKVIEKADV